MQTSYDKSQMLYQLSPEARQDSVAKTSEMEAFCSRMPLASIMLSKEKYFPITQSQSVQITPQTGNVISAAFISVPMTATGAC